MRGQRTKTNAKTRKGGRRASSALLRASAPTKKYNKQRCEELGIDTAALEAKGYVAIATE